MTKDDVLKLEANDRLVDARDGVKATVIDVNEHVLRVRYDGELSSNYISPADCSHLSKVVTTKV
jgi:hypothetical protein